MKMVAAKIWYSAISDVNMLNCLRGMDALISIKLFSLFYSRLRRLLAIWSRWGREGLGRGRYHGQVVVGGKRGSGDGCLGSR